MHKPNDIDVIYDKIIIKLKDSNNLDVIHGIENSSAGASTGSEGLMDQGAYLLNLKQTNPSVYYIINQEIEEYLEYCKRHGLIIK